MAAAALPAGCALRSPTMAAAAPPGSTAVRPPAPGQRWRYRLSDGLTRAVVGTVDESIATVDADIVIDRRLEGSGPPSTGEASWSQALAEHFAVRPPASQSLPLEVQRPWGMIEVDPHWDLPQVFLTPVPAWPEELRPGWRRTVDTRYVVRGRSGVLGWRQSMRAVQWERVTVSAGSFTALRYRSDIVFTHVDWARIHCNRQDVAWIAPEVGRWIKRTSSGSYYINDTIDSSAYSEDVRVWELLEWS